MISKLLSIVILIPLAIILIVFCVANRQMTAISLDPLGTMPQLQVTAPLFVLLMVALIVGVVLGGIGTWFTQAHYRRTAWRRKNEVERLRREAEEARQRAQRLRTEREGASTSTSTALAPVRSA
ncbi:LapA family protein [Consotaella aegiceratis]|uniref:LapA family protein n=1 Tax=Consotaella aegiceratis TaxID=3097961 RepID=UPI002F412A89